MKSVIKWITLQPKEGSQPLNGHSAPLLANSSVISFPSIPSWPGTYIKGTLWRLASSFRILKESGRLAPRHRMIPICFLVKKILKSSKFEIFHKSLFKSIKTKFQKAIFRNSCIVHTIFHSSNKLRKNKFSFVQISTVKQQQKNTI